MISHDNTITTSTTTNLPSSTMPRCSLGDMCKAPGAELFPLYKCCMCGIQLHSHERGCGSIKNDKTRQVVMCPNGFGCRPNAVVTTTTTTNKSDTPLSCDKKSCRSAKVGQKCFVDRCDAIRCLDCTARFVLEKNNVPGLLDEHGKDVVVCSKKHYDIAKKQLLLQKRGGASWSVVRRIAWASDGINGPADPVNSEAILIHWLTTDGNYAKYRGKEGIVGRTKTKFAQIICREIAAQGIRVPRKEKDVLNKIENIERKFQAAHDWATSAMGVGMQQTDACQFANIVRRKCKHYFDLLQVFVNYCPSGHRPKVTTVTDERHGSDDFLEEENDIIAAPAVAKQCSPDLDDFISSSSDESRPVIMATPAARKPKPTTSNKVANNTDSEDENEKLPVVSTNKPTILVSTKKSPKKKKTKTLQDDTHHNDLDDDITTTLARNRKHHMDDSYDDLSSSNTSCDDDESGTTPRATKKAKRTKKVTNTSSDDETDKIPVLSTTNNTPTTWVSTKKSTPKKKKTKTTKPTMDDTTNNNNKNNRHDPTFAVTTTTSLTSPKEKIQWDEMHSETLYKQSNLAYKMDLLRNYRELRRDKMSKSKIKTIFPDMEILFSSSDEE